MLSSPLKDGRRVLGQKTTNASSKPRSNHGSTMGSPLKPCRDPPAPTVFSPRPHAGQKRSIDQVEAPQAVPGPLNSAPVPTQRGAGFQVFAEDSQASMDSEKAQVRAILTGDIFIRPIAKPMVNDIVRFHHRRSNRTQHARTRLTYGTHRGRR
jgi:hypothetical protein